MKNLSKIPELIESKSPLFEYYPPKNSYIGFISIPHSGLEVPADMKPYLSTNMNDLNSDVDFYVHKLIDIEEFQNNGIAVLKSNIHRTAIDLNRSEDIACFAWKKNSKGIEIVLEKPSLDQKQYFLNQYYKPYYEMMKALINELYNYQEIPSIIDLHSMPSKATDYHLKINPNQKVMRPDFCLSDRSGQSCEQKYIDEFTHSLGKDYKNVTQNDPYFGGHVTQHINDHFQNTNNIQIEINRSLYMNEQTFELIEEKAHSLKQLLTKCLLQGINKFSS